MRVVAQRGGRVTAAEAGLGLEQPAKATLRLGVVLGVPASLNPSRRSNRTLNCPNQRKRCSSLYTTAGPRSYAAPAPAHCRALTHDAEEGTGTPMLMARSGHTSVRSLAKYARVSAEALARHQAERDPARLSMVVTYAYTPRGHLAPLARAGGRYATGDLHVCRTDRVCARHNGWMSTTPSWLPFAVAGIGVLGTLAAGIAGALIAQR